MRGILRRHLAPWHKQLVRLQAIRVLTRLAHKEKTIKAVARWRKRFEEQSKLEVNSRIIIIIIIIIIIVLIIITSSSSSCCILISIIFTTIVFFSPNVPPSSPFSVSSMHLL